MAQLLIDTDVLIDYLRDREQAVAYLESLPPPLSVSAVTVAELYSGVRSPFARELFAEISVRPTVQAWLTPLLPLQLKHSVPTL